MKKTLLPALLLAVLLSGCGTGECSAPAPRRTARAAVQESSGPTLSPPRSTTDAAPSGRTAAGTDEYNAREYSNAEDFYDDNYDDFDDYDDAEQYWEDNG
jgi:hypothetical protein